MLRDAIKQIAKELNIQDTWDLELGAMLCEIGRITIPASTIVKEKTGAPLSEPEQEMIMRVPEIGHQLLSKIPRLESVARIVLYQKKNFNGSGFPKDNVSGVHIPLGSRIIKIFSDFYKLESTRNKRDSSLSILRYRQDIYDPDILNCAIQYLTPCTDGIKLTQKAIRSVSVAELKVGQMLLSDIVTGSGTLLIPSGNIISESLRERIRNFGRLQGIREPIKIEERENS
jgi:response regulator RpfG family c-di-GMP phosphodiesterase